MYRILIADDSATEIECILYLIKKFGIPACTDTANDGRQALELLKQNRYDILLTDIKMPFIDGLELSREARQLQPRLAIMIFSGYGEFEYAQSAISLGVTEYLLKPVDAAVFREALDRVIGDLNRRRDLHRNVQLARRHLLFTLLNGERVHDSEQALTPDCQLMMVISFGHDFFSAEGEQFESLLEQALDGPFDFVSLYPSEGLLFFPSESPAPEQLAESLHALADSLTGAPCEISWTALNDSSEILPAYQRLSRLESGDPSTENLPFPLEACMEAIRGGNLRLCAEHYERFRAAALDGCVHSRIYTRYAMAQVLCALNHLQPSGLSDSAIVDQIFACHDFESLDRLMLGQLSRTGVDGGDGSALRIEEIKSFVAHNYSNPDLGLKDVAAACYLTPNYLSRMFKRETGVTLLKYINDYRMKRAQSLLQSTQMKVNLIAQETGYRSASYFCQRFRDCFGVTPENYRLNALRTRPGRRPSEEDQP